MAKATVWKNVGVQMQSAAGAAKAATAVAKGAAATVSATAHGFTNGDWVMAKDVVGMWQINERIFRVATTATDSFVLEGINSTDFDDFVSGNFVKITFGHTITTATSISGSGGDFDFIDTTTIHENARSQVPGLPSAISYTMEHLWNPTDAGQVAMKLASDSQSMRAFKFQFGTGGDILVFAGYVGFAGLPGGSAQDKVTTQAVFTLNGTPTYYGA